MLIVGPLFMTLLWLLFGDYHATIWKNQSGIQATFSDDISREKEGARAIH
jgi:hypothetical protein